MKYHQVLVSIAVLAAAASYVYGAECSTEISGVCYSCPEGYPNNLLDNGECFCTNDANEKVACIKDAASAVASESLTSGAVRLGPGVALSAGVCLFVLFFFHS